MPRESDVGDGLSEALQTYDILSQQHRHDNRMIHTTFYLNIVLIAGLLTIMTGNSLSRWFQLCIAVLAFFVFPALGTWTWLYASERRQIKLKKDCVVEALPEANQLRTFQDETSTPERLLEHVKFYSLILVFYLVPWGISVVWFATLLIQ